jgi:hypothetical protein
MNTNMRHDLHGRGYQHLQRHHRGDAHRAAWAAAGLTLTQLRALTPQDPQRQAIEDATNRLDEPIYQALSAAERDELLAGLGALPG